MNASLPAEQKSHQPLRSIVERVWAIPPATIAIHALTAYIVAVSAYTLYLSVAARLTQSVAVGFGEQSDPLFELGTSLGFWGMLCMLLNLVLATRWEPVERLFGGMDHAYRAHALIGRAAFVMIALHLAILVLQALPDGELVATYLLPGLDLSFTLGMLGAVGLMVLVILTLWIAIPYGAWLVTHRAIGGTFVLGGAHAAFAQGDWYLITMTVLGAGVWLYTLWGYYRYGPGSPGSIVDNQRKGEINELVIELDRSLPSAPGQYVLFSVQDARRPLERTPHPFSISRILSPISIRLSAKRAGDYTRELHHLQPGDRVRVFGPHGRFGHTRADLSTPHLWIAGGIGITPFLSMLHAEAAKSPADRMPVTFVWSVREPGDAVYHDEILALAETLPNLRYHLHISSQDGRLDYGVLARLAGTETIRSTHVHMCGPVPMLRALREQLTVQGLSPRRIHSEEFAFR